MEAALQVLLPKLLGSTSFSLHPHQGKDDLLAKLPGKLSAYAKWMPTTYRAVVVIDRDNDDCTQLKTKIESMARNAGLSTRTSSRREWRFVSRFAIEELEAWYFGDWTAVRAAYPKVAAGIPRKSAFRDPDAIAGGTCEAFERVLQDAGYFSTGLRKIEVARAVAAHMEPRRNVSTSFRAFAAVLRMLASP